MSATSTRRAILAGAATLPALSVPAIAAAADPIFAAIERHRQAEAAFTAACHAMDNAPSLEGAEALVGARLDRAVQEYTVLTGMTPTTVAGCAALLRYIEAHEAKYRHEGVVLFSDSGSDEIRTAGKSLLSRIASALDAS